MSTFGGLMTEFPDIRVDYFREIPGHKPPLKCFLSHIHSDHLNGLENFKACFVYCSPATKELLIRLEIRRNRIDFENGVLEARKQTFKALEPRLKTIPLETPTRIELEPNNVIQVTLFDANHCTGAVMFLFEGDGKAVLYTGDIRSEPWFVNNLTRNPFLIEYTSGMKTLDSIYLDTSNIDPKSFPTKAEGLKELVRKVSQYPEDTVFHFSAWTWGYEDVYVALSRALKSQIHVDNYTMRMYRSLSGKPDSVSGVSGPFISHEGPVLTGYTCGNTFQEGCLTNDPKVRIHSCVKGISCPAIKGKAVMIRPIVARLRDGTELAEKGVGGGGQDLVDESQLELDTDLIAHVLSEINNLGKPDSLNLGRRFLAGLSTLGGFLPVEDKTDLFSDDGTLAPLPFVKAMEKALSERQIIYASAELQDGALPRQITFPYSRHSSYPELCDLVRAFKPKDVYQCTVNEVEWREEYSVRKLFGHECSASIFRHDAEIREKQAKTAELQKMLPQSSQQTQTTASSPLSSQAEQFLRRTSLSLPGTPKRELRRGSDGRLRLYDKNGAEATFASQPMLASSPLLNRTSASQDSLPSTQPTHAASGWSPGSASQAVRRKRIVDELEAESTKRLRFTFESPGSSPSVSRDANIGVATESQSSSQVRVSQGFPGVESRLSPKPRSTVATETKSDQAKPVTNVALSGTTVAGSNSSGFQGLFQNAVKTWDFKALDTQRGGITTTTSGAAVPVENISGSEAQIQENIPRLRLVVPYISRLAAKNALVAAHGNLDDALIHLGEEGSPVGAVDNIQDNAENLAAETHVRANVAMSRKGPPYISKPVVKRTLSSDHGNFGNATGNLIGDSQHGKTYDISDDEDEIVLPVSKQNPKESVPEVKIPKVLADVDNRQELALGVQESTVQDRVKISTETTSKTLAELAEEASKDAGGPESSGESSQADTPGSDDSGGEGEDEMANNSDMDDGTEQHYWLENTFFDYVDNVTRCNLCGHEMWSECIGFCTGCEEGHSEDPYLEVLEPDTGAKPEYEINEDAEMDLQDMLDPYLDCDSSAYDSHDEDPKFTEEYEVNSFIDDSPEAESDDEDANAEEEEEEINWEERYRALAAAHTSLTYAYGYLDEKYRQYKIAVEGDDYETSDEDEDGDGLENGEILVVDVAVQDPVVTELVLSQAQGQSQEEEISPARVRDRVEAFEAARNGAWRGISMLSTGDNHTYPEIEL